MKNLFLKSIIVNKGNVCDCCNSEDSLFYSIPAGYKQDLLNVKEPGVFCLNCAIEIIGANPHKQGEGREPVNFMVRNNTERLVKKYLDLSYYQLYEVRGLLNVVRKNNDSLAVKEFFDRTNTILGMLHDLRDDMDNARL